MTNLSNKLTKKAIGTFMLVLLIPSQSAYAQSVSVEVPTAMVSTQAVAPTQPEPIEVSTVEPTVQEVLLNVCQENGYGQDCAKTLLGMVMNESSNISTAIGDHGLARGYFQIHVKLHNITIACAEDLVCSANWTINYMEAHSYPKYVSYAVQCHNSCNVNNGYAAKAARNAKRYWNQPLEVTQAAPIELAMN